MTNFEKLTKAFCDAFVIDADKVKALKYRECEMWDSVGHMTLINNIEDAFDIMILPEDLMNFTSFSVGKDILSQHYNIQF